MMRLLIFLLCCVPLLALAADTPPLGRLFLTPTDRAALDAVRQNSKPPEKIIKPSEKGDEEASAESAPVASLPIVTIHGFVKRSDGKSTVWVNGKPMQEKSSSKDLEVGRLQGNTNQVPIKIPSTGQTVILKAGQSYDPASGKMADSLRDLPQQAVIEPVAAPSRKAAGAKEEKDKAKENGQNNGAVDKNATAKPAPTALPPSP
jgi:hypothetical protein